MGILKNMKNRVNYRPQPDFGVPVEEDFDEPMMHTENTEPDIEFMSRNKMLQQKYDQNFHSHIISTNTVSLVSENKVKQEVERMQLVPDEIYISSEEDSFTEISEVRIQSPFLRKVSVRDETGDSEKPGVKDVKKLISKAFLQKIRSQISSLNGSGLDRSGTFKKNLPINFKLKKQASKRKGYAGSKSSTKMLRRQTNSDRKPLRRLTNNKRLQSFKNTSSGLKTVARRLGRIDKMTAQQVSDMVDQAIDIEEAPYEEGNFVNDEYLDAEFDLESAIKNAKESNKNK